MGVVCLMSFGVLLSSVGVAHRIPQYGNFPRQAVSNSTLAPSTAFSTPTATSSSSVATITSSSNGTCPTTYAADFPQVWMTWSEPCQSAQDWANSDNADYADECLRAYCDAQFDSLTDSYISASITETTTSTRTFFSGEEGTGTLSGVVTRQTFWTETFTFIQPPAKAVTPAAPCCNLCTLSAQTIELFFWPPATATASPVVTGLPPNATAAVSGLSANGSGSYVDDSGFTFISPSIYIAFTSLGAHNRCGAVGTALYNTTMAFDPSEISSILPYTTTATCTITDPNIVDDDKTITRGEAGLPPPQPLTYSDVAQNCSSIAGYYYFSENPFYQDAGDPCHPVIAIPDRVKQLQPAWRTCGAGYNGGFYDPPRTLQEAPVLVPTATPGPGITTVAPSTSVPALPEETPIETPEPPPASEPQQPDPPASQPQQPDPPASQPQQPDPPASQPQQPDPPASQIGQPNPPASQSQQPNPPASQPNPPSQPSNGSPQQPQPPAQQPGSSTTIVITPPPTNPNSNPNPTNNNPNPQPPANSPPVVTLAPGTNPADPGQVITLIPTTIPSNPNDPNAPNNPQNPGPTGPAVVIGTQTLSPGQVITVGGTTSTLPNGQTTVLSGTAISLDPQGTQVIVGGSSTIALPPQPTGGSPAVVTIGSSTFAVNSAGQIVIGTQTISPGSSAIVVGGTTSTLANGQTTVIGGTTVSLAPGATQIVVDGSTIPLTPNSQQTGSPVVITLDGTTLTANSLTQFVFGSSTLSVGGPAITVSGTTYSLTTNEQGSTVLVAGTAGASSGVNAGATTTGFASGARTGGAANPSGTGPAAPENTGGAGGLRVGMEVVVTVVLVAVLLG